MFHPFSNALHGDCVQGLARKQAGELIDISEAKRAGFEYGNKIKSTMLRWPALLAAPLAAAKTKKVARKILITEINKLLENLSMVIHCMK